jgi:hypothetical protein
MPKADKAKSTMSGSNQHEAAYAYSVPSSNPSEGGALSPSVGAHEVPICLFLAPLPPGDPRGVATGWSIPKISRPLVGASPRPSEGRGSTPSGGLPETSTWHQMLVGSESVSTGVAVAWLAWQYFSDAGLGSIEVGLWRLSALAWQSLGFCFGL